MRTEVLIRAVRAGVSSSVARRMISGRLDEVIGFILGAFN